VNRQVKLRLWLLLSLLASAITWLYMSRVLLPWEYFIDVEHGRLKSQLGDLYPRWVGTRELLLHGRNPYGPEVSHQIQTAFYGHAINQKYGEPGGDVIDEQRFAYPVYVVFFLAPTVYLDFSLLQTWAPVVFAVLTAISVLLWMRVLRWRPPRILTVAIALFVIASPQVAQGLRLRQLGLVVAFLIALSAWCIARDHLAIAGVLLAISTVKPQMVLLPLLWFLLWGASQWTKRWPLLAGFGITLAGLTAAGEIILPGWLRFFVEGLIAYRKYFPTTSLLCLAVGSWIGGALSGIVVTGLLALAWRNRQPDSASPEFIQTLAAFLIGTTLVLPLLTPFNQVLLLLPVLMIIQAWPAVSRIGRGIFAAVVVWPWITSLVLLLLHPRLDSPKRVPLLPSALVLFLPFLAALLSLRKLLQTSAPRLEPGDLSVQ
jgi:hypothetical protein